MAPGPARHPHNPNKKKIARTKIAKIAQIQRCARGMIGHNPFCASCPPLFLRHFFKGVFETRKKKIATNSAGPPPRICLDRGVLAWNFIESFACFAVFLAFFTQHATHTARGGHVLFEARSRGYPHPRTPAPAGSAMFVNRGAETQNPFLGVDFCKKCNLRLSLKFRRVRGGPGGLPPAGVWGQSPQSMVDNFLAKN